MELLMIVQDVFQIKGRGQVVVGRLECDVTLGENVIINNQEVSIADMEQYNNKNIKSLHAGATCGLLINGYDGKIGRGDKMYKMGNYDLWKGFGI